MGRSRPAACPETRHYCPEPGCGRSFTRQDHLRRHTANHDPGRARHCPDCGRGFARPDVLAAHVRKHEQDAATSARPPALLVDPGLSATGHVGDNLESAFFEPEMTKPNEMDECAPEDLEALYVWLMNGSSDLVPTVDGLADASFDDFAHVEVPEVTSKVDDVLPEPPHPLLYAQNRPFAVDETLRSRLLAFLFALPELASSTYFACDALSTSLELYWTSFAPTFPLLHGPTFDLQASTGLLASLIIVGMCVSPEKAVYDLGATVLSKMRPLLLLHEVSGPDVPLETFQALVILGQAGQMLLDGREHALSYSTAAHDFGISRNMDIWYPRWYKRFEMSCGSDEERWRAWAASESWSRLCYAIMLRDIQLSSVFGHLPVRALSMLIIRLRMPASEASWVAPSAEAWAAQPATSSAPFCQVFKDVLLARTSSPSTASSSQPEPLCPFGLSTILHGLMSLAWDVKWRGTLRADALAPLHKSLNWRGSLQSAYGRLGREVLDTLGESILTASERTISLASLDLLFVSELELVADLTSMLTFAGVMRIGSRNVGPDDFALASRSIRKWVSSRDAEDAASLAATYLRRRLAVADLEEGWTFSKGLWAPWSLYLATLTIWTFASLRRSREPPPLVGLNAAPLFPLFADFPASWHGDDLPPFMQAMATLLSEQRWGLGKEAGAVLQSLVERRVASVS
ncbi:hypothetical protein JCM9279_000783 [Rhodotorula babjevae]